MEKRADTPATPEIPQLDAVNIGIAPVPNGVHLHFEQIATGFTIDLVFSTDDAVGFATAIMHMAHIGKTADPPTFN